MNGLEERTESKTPEAATSWKPAGHVKDFPPNAGQAVLIEGKQYAIYNFVTRGEWYACQNMCPHKGDMLLGRGLTGDKGGEPVVACPMHKKVFSLDNGACLSDPEYEIQTFPVRVENDRVFIKIQ